MAKLAPKDAVFEGRQYTASSKTSIQKWLDAQIVKTDDDSYAIVKDGDVEVEDLYLNDWIVLDPHSGVISIYTEEQLVKGLVPIKVHDGLTYSAPPVDNQASFGKDEIEKRFGHHKATIEGPNATLRKHEMLRGMFKEFAGRLDQVLPQGRYKSLVMTELETASMWSHKSIAEFSAEGK